MLPMSPAQFRVNEALDSAPAPTVGEHNEEVLRELGYSDEDIAALRDSGAVSG